MKTRSEGDKRREKKDSSWFVYLAAFQAPGSAKTVGLM